ncbi:MAG: ABC transporter permease [bacterium]
MSTRTARAASALPLAFVGVLVAWPVAMVLITGLAPRSLEVLATASTWRIVAYTTAQALLSTALSLALAMPAAYALYRLRVPGRAAMLAVLTVPFVLPTVVVGLAFRELLPFAGTTAAIIVAHVFFNVGLVIRVVGGLWAMLDPRWEEVAATLGLSPWRAHLRATWPLLRPAITASAILVFLFTFTSFGVVLIVGDPSLPTIEVDIYQRTVQRLDLSGAAGLALLQLVVVAVALLVSAVLQDRLAVRQALRPDAFPARTPATVLDRAAAAYTVLLAIAVVVPLLALLSRSLRVGGSWGLAWYAELPSPTDTSTRAVPAIEAVGLSLRYAVIATVIATALGVLAAVGINAARRRGALLDAAVTLPLGVSAVTIGFGLLLASLRGPVDMRGWWILVPLGQALVAMPVVVRVVLPVLRSLDPRLRQVAGTLGAPPLRAWLATEGAITSRAVAVGAALACAISLGEFGATAFLVRADNPTMPIQIVRLLGRPGEANLGQACALAVVLVLLTLVVVAVAERLRPAGKGGW